MTQLAKWIEAALKKFCELCLWANFILIFLIVFQVVARYAFNFTWASLEELQWHLFAFAMFTGVAYAIVENSHVRADLLFAKFAKKWQDRVELLTMVFCVIPFFSLILFYSLSFVERSYAVGEMSSAPGGLPYRWLIKALIPLACLLINFAALAKILRLIDALRGKDVS
ncbi:C4-dicarboxylate transporter family protein, DctQ subunit [Lentisphaera araneosa HTCC2155]|jgi:TRAP-type mannitol/chloroaromatic compound transport system permease small subunit|uniref:C4-dicarboxylate transporter family protein, DctQ subunit n=1 Tax=Lentisphaera araneosa HTCC2155 TaxID=313628 RepID=A6DRT4_9BACT|nr:TRAP transporter small permease subunit [Lentisphaera araneosa]EDM25619.1 C4-dicarboxylate transporter family protein, DctQ subunit [Lentisphaera araneosa HTCC2155]